MKPIQVTLRITNNAFRIVQRATAHSKTGLFRDYGVAEAPPNFQAGWSDCMYFSSLSVHFVCSSGVFRVRFCIHEVTLPFGSCAQLPCREEASVSFVVLGVLEPQIARHWFRAISCHLANSVGRSLLRRAFFRVRPQFICGHPRGRGLSTRLVKIFLRAQVNGIRATWPVHRRRRRL
jgi:hypothetical protein